MKKRQSVACGYAKFKKLVKVLCTIVVGFSQLRSKRMYIDRTQVENIKICHVARCMDGALMFGWT